ncbi:hypothetical protein RFI_02135 [Reticulomyxa filosa]|uniref:Uncharacterized protein n=1 Tax=Reticulomyxa filosa TaxID=46433 RepID=X6PA60_RETFI|nr:hypothetical protein RFI_02135 [Reticulomyxa filosa]|eukprot:ETO34939.1 hypothetical protein RFI_02135 [Reticulomyxa filosa]
MKRLLQMEMQACKRQVDEINNHWLGLKQACESVDNEDQSLNKSIEALILELANQRILHKLQSFIESIQKTGIIIKTVKKEELEKIMNLFQNITTLFASTLNQAQIFSCCIYFSSAKSKETIAYFVEFDVVKQCLVEFLSECNKTREHH